MKELTSIPELCEECSRCERECPQNGIRVINGVPLFCLHCSPDRAPCLVVCPENAISGIDGAIVVDEDMCIGCGLCQDACPIGAIHLNESGIAKKCNLCIDRETPICTLICPTKALRLDSEDIVAEKREPPIKELEKVKVTMKY